jgi:hypothetical protein
MSQRVRLTITRGSRLAERLAPVLGADAVYRPGRCSDGHPNRGRAIGEPCQASLATVDDYLGIFNLTEAEVLARFAGKTCLKPVGRQPVNFLDPRSGLDLFETWARTSGAVLINVTCHPTDCSLHLLTPRLTHPVPGEGPNLVTAIWTAVDRALGEGG